MFKGFPRTVEQAEKLQSMEPINMALNLVVPHSVIIERAKGRLVHLPSGRVYNAGFKDPKVPVNGPFFTVVFHKLKIYY